MATEQIQGLRPFALNTGVSLDVFIIAFASLFSPLTLGQDREARSTLLQSLSTKNGIKAKVISSMYVE